MKLYPDKLANSVSQSLAPLYLLSGEEPLLMNEAADLLRQAAKQHGFLERETFDASLPGFDWEDVLQSLNSLSLFAEKKLVEIRCGKKHLADERFVTYWERPNPDNVVVVITEKFDKTAQNSKWFMALEKIGAFVAIWPLDNAELPRWLSQRAKQQGLHLAANAIPLLQERTEGNLLAAAQELEKLFLLFGHTPISAEMLADSVANNARYDVFTLTDSLLAGDAAGSLAILHSLLEEGGAEFQVFRALLRELHTLGAVQEALQAGQPLNTALQRNGVWGKRQTLYPSALKRLGPKQLALALQQCHQVDLAIMGLVKKKSRDELESLCLAFCH